MTDMREEHIDDIETRLGSVNMFPWWAELDREDVVDLIAAARERDRLREALQKSADRFHGLSDEPPHQFHVFRDCPDDYCLQARAVLQGRKP